MLQTLSSPKFLFVVAQPEAKKWLIAELGRVHPELRLAYSRPGLYTFKPDPHGFASDFCLKSVFARHHGFSLGNVSGPAGVAALLAPMSPPMRLHVFPRDPGESGPTVAAATLEVCRNEILGLAQPGCLIAEPAPRIGDYVLDVILPPEPEQGEPWFVGYHRHERGRSPHPGAVLRKVPPPLAPSRAWSKIEEVLTWSGIAMRAGEVAVEIGCAPGGALLALIERGLSVVGVDPAQLDPRVLAHAAELSANVQHLACPVAALRREQLPKRVDWLLCDANLAPQVAIRYLAYWVKALRPHLRGLVFTMKMNDQRAVDAIPRLVARVAEFGLGEPRAVQLPSHRSEIAVTACRTASRHKHR
jgi:23S rRNA (cytidine2498-2'-O)-methyltransferase